jgi:hypothetical protein
VIVSGGKTRITSTPILEPALLKTCSTIRQEAIAIYYLENRFDIDCSNWRHSAYQEFYKIYPRHVTASEQARVDNVFWINTRSWTCKANLLEFLKEFHDGRLKRGFKYSDPAGKNEMIGGAFEVVKTMHGHSWSTVDRLLNVYLDQVAKGKQPWELD